MKILLEWIWTSYQNACCNLECAESIGAVVGKRLDMRVKNIHNEYSSCSQFKKYHSSVVNLGIYTSLQTGENCNKCISAFCLHIFDLKSNTSSRSFFFFLLHWREMNMLAQDLHVFRLQVNVNIWESAARTCDRWEKWFEMCTLMSSTDVILPPILEEKKCWITTRLDRKLHLFFFFF